MDINQKYCGKALLPILQKTVTSGTVIWDAGECFHEVIEDIEKAFPRKSFSERFPPKENDGLIWFQPNQTLLEYDSVYMLATPELRAHFFG